MGKREYELVIPAGLEKHQYINTYRISHTETEILLDFGNLIRNEEVEDKKVELVSRLALPPSLLVKLMLDLYRAGQDYEKSYKLDIGFGIEENETE